MVHHPATIAGLEAKREKPTESAVSLIQLISHGAEPASVKIHIASLQDKIEWMATIHGAVVMAMELDSGLFLPLLRAFDLVKDFEVADD